MYCPTGISALKWDKILQIGLGLPITDRPPGSV